jgi:sec-independent protein translocase protein TatB
MLDIAWPELVVIGDLALVAIGPKDLTIIMHTLGRWIGKARGMIHDIQRSIEQLSYETEIAEKLDKEQQTPPPSAAAENAPDKPRSGHD